MKENTKNVKLCGQYKWNWNKTMNLEIKGCGLDVGKYYKHCNLKCTQTVKYCITSHIKVYPRVDYRTRS